LAYRPWDERRLAYPIAKHKKGLYYLMYFRSEGKNLAPLEHDMALNEMIIRSMILKIDPKLVDTMLALVKGEHAPALHSIQDEPMFIDCKVFNRGEMGKKADIAEQYLDKGHLVFLEGHLVFEQWDDKQTGQKRSKHAVVVDDFQFLEPKKDGAGGGSYQRQSS